MAASHLRPGSLYSQAWTQYVCAQTGLPLASARNAVDERENVTYAAYDTLLTSEEHIAKVSNILLQGHTLPRSLDGGFRDLVVQRANVMTALWSQKHVSNPTTRVNIPPKESDDNGSRQLPLSAQFAIKALFPLLDAVAGDNDANKLRLQAQVFSTLADLLKDLPLMWLHQEPLEPLLDLKQQVERLVLHDDVESKQQGALVTALLGLGVHIGDVATLVSVCKTLVRVLNKRGSQSPSLVNNSFFQELDANLSVNGLGHTGLMASGLYSTFIHMWHHPDTGPPEQRDGALEKRQHFPFTSAGLACDGRFLYLKNQSGLFRIGTGYGLTVRGHEYASNRTLFRAGDNVDLVFVSGRLFCRTRRMSSKLVLELDPVTLRPLTSPEEKKDCAALPFFPGQCSRIFTDGKNMYAYLESWKEFSSSVSSCAAQGACTYLATGREFRLQVWYNCRTCSSVTNNGCCQACVDICHQGHDVVEAGNSPSKFYCDCGAGELPEPCQLAFQGPSDKSSVLDIKKGISIAVFEVPSSRDSAISLQKVVPLPDWLDEPATGTEKKSSSSSSSSRSSGRTFSLGALGLKDALCVYATGGGDIHGAAVRTMSDGTQQLLFQTTNLRGDHQVTQHLFGSRVSLMGPLCYDAANDIVWLYNPLEFRLRQWRGPIKCGNTIGSQDKPASLSLSYTVRGVMERLAALLQLIPRSDFAASNANAFTFRHVKAFSELASLMEAVLEQLEQCKKKRDRTKILAILVSALQVLRHGLGLSIGSELEADECTRIRSLIELLAWTPEYGNDVHEEAVSALARGLQVLYPTAEQQVDLLNMLEDKPGDTKPLYFALARTPQLQRMWVEGGKTRKSVLVSLLKMSCEESTQLVKDFVEVVKHPSIAPSEYLALVLPTRSIAPDAAATKAEPSFNPYMTPIMTLLVSALESVLSNADKDPTFLLECAEAVCASSAEFLSSSIALLRGTKPKSPEHRHGLSAILASSVIGLNLSEVLYAITALAGAPRNASADAGVGHSGVNVLPQLVEVCKASLPKLLGQLDELSATLKDGTAAATDAEHHTQGVQINRQRDLEVGLTQIIESSHPFSLCDNTYEVRIDTADALRLEFDPQCSPELLELGTLSWGNGSSLSGFPQTSIVQGNSLRLQWKKRSGVSRNGNENLWGFLVRVTGVRWALPVQLPSWLLDVKCSISYLGGLCAALAVQGTAANLAPLALAADPWLKSDLFAGGLRPVEPPASSPNTVAQDEFIAMLFQGKGKAADLHNRLLSVISGRPLLTASMKAGVEPVERAVVAALLHHAPRSLCEHAMKASSRLPAVTRGSETAQMLSPLYATAYNVGRWVLSRGRLENKLAELCRSQPTSSADARVHELGLADTLVLLARHGASVRHVVDAHDAADSLFSLVQKMALRSSSDESDTTSTSDEKSKEEKSSEVAAGFVTPPAKPTGRRSKRSRKRKNRKQKNKTPSTPEMTAATAKSNSSSGSPPQNHYVLVSEHLLEKLRILLLLSPAPDSQTPWDLSSLGPSDGQVARPAMAISIPSHVGQVATDESTCAEPLSPLDLSNAGADDRQSDDLSDEDDSLPLELTRMLTPPSKFKKYKTSPLKRRSESSPTKVRKQTGSQSVCSSVVEYLCADSDVAAGVSVSSFLSLLKERRASAQLRKQGLSLLQAILSASRGGMVRRMALSNNIEALRDRWEFYHALYANSTTPLAAATSPASKGHLTSNHAAQLHYCRFLEGLGTDDLQAVSACYGDLIRVLLDVVRDRSLEVPLRVLALDVISFSTVADDIPILDDVKFFPSLMALEQDLSHLAFPLLGGGDETKTADISTPFTPAARRLSFIPSTSVATESQDDVIMENRRLFFEDSWRFATRAFSFVAAHVLACESHHANPKEQADRERKLESLALAIIRLVAERLEGEAKTLQPQSDGAPDDSVCSEVADVVAYEWLVFLVRIRRFPRARRILGYSSPANASNASQPSDAVQRLVHSLFDLTRRSSLRVRMLACRLLRPLLVAVGPSALPKDMPSNIVNFLLDYIVELMSGTAAAQHRIRLQLTSKSAKLLEQSRASKKPASSSKSKSSSSSSSSSKDDSSKDSDKEEKTYTVVIRLPPGCTATRYLDEEYYHVFQSSKLKKHQIFKDMDLAAWVVRLRRSLTEHKEAVVYSGPKSAAAHVAAVLAQYGVVSNVSSQEQGSLRRNIMQLAKGFPRVQISGEVALSLISEVVYVLRTLLQSTDWRPLLSKLLSGALSKAKLADCVSNLTKQTDTPGKTIKLFSGGQVRALGALIVAGAETDGIRPGGRVRLVDDNSASAKAPKEGTVLSFDKANEFAQVAFDDDLSSSVAMPVPVSRLVSLETVPPQWDHFSLSSNVISGFLEFLQHKDVCGLEESVKQAPIAVGTETKEKEEKTPLGGGVDDQPDAAEEPPVEWGRALLALMKSCVVGTLSSYLESVNELVHRDRSAASKYVKLLTQLVPQLQRLSESSPPSLAVKTIRKYSRNSLVRAIDTLSDEFVAQRNPKEPLKAEKRATLHHQPSVADPSKLPSRWFEFSAPNLMFSSPRSVQFVASHTLSRQEEGIPTVKRVVVTADKHIPADNPRLTEYYFEVRLERVAGSPENVSVGIRAPQGDWLLCGDGKLWSVRRDVFHRDTLGVGSYIDVRDTAQRPPKWEPCRVIDSKDNKVQVGWLYWKSTEYHQWIERKSDLIAPFLTNTAGGSPVNQDRKVTDFCSPFKEGDTIGCELNLVTGNLSFTRNGKPLGVAAKGLPLYHYKPAVELACARARVNANFGQHTFKYAGYERKYNLAASTTTKEDSKNEAFYKRMQECENSIALQEKALQSEAERYKHAEEAKLARRLNSALEIMAMIPGCAEEQLMRALEMHGDDAQRTMNWIFNQPDPFAAVAALEIPAPAPKPKEKTKSDRTKPKEDEPQPAPDRPPSHSHVTFNRQTNLSRSYEYDDDVEEQSKKSDVSEELQIWLSEVASGLRRARLERPSVERIMNRLKANMHDVVALLQAREVMPSLRDPPSPEDNKVDEAVGNVARPPFMDELEPGIRVTVAPEALGHDDSAKMWLDEMDDTLGASGVVTAINTETLPPLVLVRLEDELRSMVHEWWFYAAALRVVPPSCCDACVGCASMANAVNGVISTQEHITRVHARQAMLSVMGIARHLSTPLTLPVSAGSSTTNASPTRKLVLTALHAAAGEYLDMGLPTHASVPTGAVQSYAPQLKRSLSSVFHSVPDPAQLYVDLLNECVEYVTKNATLHKVLPEGRSSKPQTVCVPGASGLVLSLFNKQSSASSAASSSDDAPSNDTAKAVLTVYGNASCRRVLRRVEVSTMRPVVIPEDQVWIKVTEQEVDLLVSPVHWAFSVVLWMVQNQLLSAQSLLRHVNTTSSTTSDTASASASSAYLTLGAPEKKMPVTEPLKGDPATTKEKSRLPLNAVHSKLLASSLSALTANWIPTEMRCVLISMTLQLLQHVDAVDALILPDPGVLKTLAGELQALHRMWTQEKGVTLAPTLLQDLWALMVELEPLARAVNNNTPIITEPWFLQSLTTAQWLQRTASSGKLVVNAPTVMDKGQKYGPLGPEDMELEDVNEEEEEEEEEEDDDEDDNDTQEADESQWTADHDVALVRIVQHISDEASAAATKMSTAIETCLLVGVMLEQRGKLQFKHQVIRRKLSALVNFNKAVEQCIPLINLSHSHVPGHVAWALAQHRALVFWEVKQKVLSQVLDLTATRHAKGSEWSRFSVRIDRLAAAESHQHGFTVFEQALNEMAGKHIPLARLRTPFTPPTGVKPLLPFEVQLKGEKVVGSDGPYRAFFADVCRELQCEDIQLAVAGGDEDATTTPGLGPVAGPSGFASPTVGSPTFSPQLTPTGSMGALFLPPSPALGGRAHSSPDVKEPSTVTSPVLGATGSAGADSDDNLSPVSSARPASLGLLVKCPNGQHNVGNNRDVFVVRPSYQSEEHIAMHRFLGRLMGVAMRSSVLLSLELGSLCWKPLVGQRPDLKDLESVDVNAAKLLQKLRQCRTASQFAKEFGTQLTFTTVLSDGSRIDLESGKGADIPVTFANRRRYAALSEWTRLHESHLQLQAVRAGLNDVVPVAAFSLFTDKDLRLALCGRSTVDLQLLKKHTEYGGNLTASSTLIKNFWEVLYGFSEDERLRFVDFVYAQRRLPSAREFKRQRLRMLISPLEVQSKQNVDETFPHSDTCFFNLKLPRYTSIEALRKNLTLAITQASGFGLEADERQLDNM